MLADLKHKHTACLHSHIISPSPRAKTYRTSGELVFQTYTESPPQLPTSPALVQADP